MQAAARGAVGLVGWLGSICGAGNMTIRDNQGFAVAALFRHISKTELTTSTKLSHPCDRDTQQQQW